MMTAQRVSKFSAWAACTKPCGGGSHKRARAEDSTGKASRETVDCKINGWNPHTACTESCDSGYQARNSCIRKVILCEAFYVQADCIQNVSAKLFRAMNTIVRSTER